MVICARIWRASEPMSDMLMKFDSIEEAIEYMKRNYPSWVIEFLDRQDDDYSRKVIQRLKDAYGKCDEYLTLIMYDDYIE